jgi:hypothetical protein
MAEGKISQLTPRMESGSIFVESKNKNYPFTKLNLAQGVQFAQLQVDMNVRFRLERDYRTRKEIIKEIEPMNSQKKSNHPKQTGYLQTSHTRHGTVAANPDLIKTISDARKNLPYGFIHINTEKSVLDTPILHDGSSGGELLSGEICCTLTALTPLLPGNARYSVEEADQQKLNKWGFDTLDQDKQIAEPLRLPDGRVVIAGSALKGMIRHSLSALLDAPMERVTEHHYTYRPNLDHANPAARECRPAIVTGQNSIGEWEIDLLPAGRNVVQFRSMPAGGKKYDYRGGIDGKGILAAGLSRPMFTYSAAYVEACYLSNATQLTIPESVYQAYENTQQVLMIHHIDAHNKSKFKPDDAKREISSATQLTVNQLIYVEIEGDSPRVVSMGHHYQYRWAYTSSARMRSGKLRDCLAVHTDEEKGTRPDKLTGARLLFGYVHNDETPIGKGKYERLAGRITPNHAVSQKNPEFLGSQQGYYVPLKILGSPKPSAWEFYLQQDSSKPPATYGDLPGDAGGELAGRKYYPHQPGIQTVEQIQETDLTIIQSKQSTLARFICKSDTEFKFTLHFARLREWELGALLAVLEPYRLAENGKPNENDYAHKLGLGRPLGMGSVEIKIDTIRIRQENEIYLQEKQAADFQSAIDKLKTKLVKNEALEDWLAMHCYDTKNTQRRAYPTPGAGQTIYAWHSQIRRDYAKIRRKI